MEAEPTGTIFNIQRYSTEDGPGIRTTVFMKGCPLRCPWCHNPEGLRPNLEVIWYEERCLGCGDCVEHCPSQAILREGGGLRPDETRCRVCGRCVEICPAGARELSGRVYRVAEVMTEVEKDRVFYETSRGGVTVSGGEPLSQPLFVSHLLQQCQQAGIHTALDTSGYAPWPTLERLLEHTDLLLYDVKHPGKAFHEEHCGVDPTIIFDNLTRLAEARIPVWIRIPFIPGFNDQTETLRAMAQMVRPLRSLERIDLLPYHRLAREKYRRLGMTYRLTDMEEPPAEKLEAARQIFRAQGLPIHEIEDARARERKKDR
jgi:pyruvate formate lyase activating enzyme